MLRLLLLLGAAGIAFAAGFEVCNWRDKAGALKQAQHVITVTQKQDVAAQKVATDVTTKTTEIRYVTQIVVKEIPRYIDAQTDRSFPLSVGFVELHDAAALGLPDTSASVSGNADSASPVTESDAGKVIAENYGECRLDQARLAGWQTWYGTVDKGMKVSP